MLCTDVICFFYFLINIKNTPSTVKTRCRSRSGGRNGNGVSAAAFIKYLLISSEPLAEHSFRGPPVKSLGKSHQ